MAKIKYYRFYLEDVTNGSVFTHIFSATSKAKALELLSEYGSVVDVIAIKIITPELMERYGFTNESETEEATPEVPAPVEETEQSEDVPETSSADELETEEATPEVPAPVEESEQSDDVPETSSADEPETEESTPEAVFSDDEHRQTFYKIFSRMKINPKKDPYRESLAYLIALDVVCRQHIDEIYDFEEYCINPDCLERGWQTSTSLRTLILAFSLYTGSSDWCPDYLKYICNPAVIFCSEYAKFYFHAIGILFGDFIVASAKTEETTPEVTAPVEEPEQPDDVLETASAEMSSYPLDVPFDMRIRNLCRKCKHLESCFEKDRSEVLEPIDYNHCKCCECGVDCSLCCYRFKNIPNEISSITNIEEILSDGDLPF